MIPCYNEQDFVQRLKRTMLLEQQTGIRNGVYGFTQINMAFNSNKIEGSTLTKGQTESMFDRGTLDLDGDVTIRRKDIEELTGHFKMLNYMLSVVDEPLSEDNIKIMHKNLKENVFEDMANGYAVGDYKKRANIVGNIKTALPNEVPSKMKELLDWYGSKTDVTLRDIADFHLRFETIHPFQDGNGRVGRMIILKECLKHDIIPVIVRDSNKSQYLRALSAEGIDELTSFFEQEQEFYRDKTLLMVYEYGVDYE